MTNFHHSGGNISFQGSSAEYGGAVLERSSGVAGDASGCLWCNCSPLDTLLGSGTKLVEFPRFAFLRCLVSLPFRPDGIDILDFRQPSRSAFQPQVR